MSTTANVTDKTAKSTVLDRRFVFDFSDEELLKMISDDWAYSDAYCTQNGFFDNFRRWQQCYNTTDYVQKTTTTAPAPIILSQKGRANQFYPVSTLICDTIHAIISEALFPSDDFFFMKPGEVYDNPAVVEAAKDMLTFDLKPERSNMREQFDIWLRQALQMQWSVARVGYKVGGRNVMVSNKDVVSEWVKKLKESDSKAKQLAGKVLDVGTGGKKKRNLGKPAYTIEYDPTGDQRPEIEVYNTYNTRFDPKALDFDDNCRFFMREKEVAWSHLRANAKTKENPDSTYEESKLKQLEEAFGCSETPQQQQQAENSVEKNKSTPQQVNDMVTLRFWQNQFAEFVTDKDFKIVLHRRKKDGWDLKKMVYMPRLNAWHGYCVLERCEKLNLSFNAIKNSRRDNVNFIIEAIWAINQMAWDPNQQDNKNFPGKYIFVKGDVRAAITAIHPPDATQAADQESQEEYRWAQRVCSADENSQGQYRSGGVPSATETEVVANAQNTRMGPIVKRIEREDLRWVLKGLMKQEQLNLTDEVKFTVSGPEGAYSRTITPELLSLLGPDIDVTPIGSLVEEQQFYSRIAKLETIKVGSQIPQIADTWDWTKIGRQMLQAAKFQGVDELIKNNEFDISIPPDYENIVLQHEPIPIHDSDKHEEHIPVHQDFIDSEEFQQLDMTIQAGFQAHLQQHQEALAEAQKVSPGPQATPPIFQGMNTANALSATNAGSMGPKNQAMPGAPA